MSARFGHALHFENQIQINAINRVVKLIKILIFTLIIIKVILHPQL